MKEIIIYDGDIEIFISNRNQKTLDNKDIYILNYDNITNEIEYICKETNEYENLKLDPKELYVYNNLYEQAKYYKKKYEKSYNRNNLNNISDSNNNYFYYKNDVKYIYFKYFYSEKSIIIKMDRLQIVKNKDKKIYIKGYNKLNNKLIFEENDEIKEVDFDKLLFSEQLIKKAEIYHYNNKRKNNFQDDEQDLKRIKNKKLEIKLDSDDEQDLKRIKNKKLEMKLDSDLEYYKKNQKKSLLREKYNQELKDNNKKFEYCKNIFGELSSNKYENNGSKLYLQYDTDNLNLSNKELQNNNFNHKSLSNYNFNLDNKDNVQNSFNKDLENKKTFIREFNDQESFNKDLDDKNKESFNKDLDDKIKESFNKDLDDKNKESFFRDLGNNKQELLYKIDEKK